MMSFKDDGWLSVEKRGFVLGVEGNEKWKLDDGVYVGRER